MPVMAQSEYFTYDDDEKTIIKGITQEGVLYFSEENAITIPQQVTRVCSGAFWAIGDYYKEIENLIDKINGEHSIYVIKKLIYLLF